jgi:hypothetical protein
MSWCAPPNTKTRDKARQIWGEIPRSLGKSGQRVSTTRFHFDSGRTCSLSSSFQSSESAYICVPHFHAKLPSPPITCDPSIPHQFLPGLLTLSQASDSTVFSTVPRPRRHQPPDHSLQLVRGSRAFDEASSTATTLLLFRGFVDINPPDRSLQLVRGSRAFDKASSTATTLLLYPPSLSLPAIPFSSLPLQASSWRSCSSLLSFLRALTPSMYPFLLLPSMRYQATPATTHQTALNNSIAE